MQLVSPSAGLMQGVAVTNPVSSAFEARTEKIKADRANEVKAERDQLTFDQAQQDRKDNEMLKVFELAGDGFVDEARFYAQEKGIQVPDEVIQNADFAKGASLAGKIYGDNPAAAQKFTQAWISTPGDFNLRLKAGEAAAGVAINPENRQLQKEIALESWKQKNKAAEPMTAYQQAQIELDRDRLALDREKEGGSAARNKFVMDVYRTTAGGMDANLADQKAKEAGLLYDSMFAGTGSPQTVSVPTVQPPPAGLPPGSRYVGTSGGKPVYEDPQGGRYIDDGNP